MSYIERFLDGILDNNAADHRGLRLTQTKGRGAAFHKPRPLANKQLTAYRAAQKRRRIPVTITLASKASP